MILKEKKKKIVNQTNEQSCFAIWIDFLFEEWKRVVSMIEQINGNESQSQIEQISNLDKPSIAESLTCESIKSNQINQLRLFLKKQSTFVICSQSNQIQEFFGISIDFD